MRTLFPILLTYFRRRLKSIQEKKFNFRGRDKTSSQILDFDIFEERPKKSPEEVAEMSQKSIQLEKELNEETPSSNDTDQKEKTAFTVLEKVIKKAIGFSKDNKDEIEIEEKRAQEIETIWTHQI